VASGFKEPPLRLTKFEKEGDMLESLEVLQPLLQTIYLGTLIDISKSGIGFLTQKLLTKGETVGIAVGDTAINTPVSLPEMVRIVRMCKTLDGYIYGCAAV
jgi:hypothetical protein